VLVADYGRGSRRRQASATRSRRWPPAARPSSGTPTRAGRSRSPGVTLATPNGSEARHFAPGHDGPLLSATTARARELAGRWSATAVSITLSGRGALLVSGDGAPSVLPAPVVPCPDPCGAGDRFASTAAGLLADGALPSEAVAGAVAAASAFVAAGGAASVRVGRPSPAAGAVRETAEQLVARVRAAGGTVVATGGCFDLLHAGHVSVLSQARSLGDCLVVLLNSDDSVRRLKGESRPLQTQADRATVLSALEHVDAVVVFDEDTPVTALEQLRPDVWAKGGDYALADLPEAPVLERGAARRSSCPT
jgi:rfaE bifunctional protein nucleotidyltransferase chain/domain